MTRRLRRLLPAAALALAIGAFWLSDSAPVCRALASANDTEPSDYCYQMDIDIEYTGSAPLTNYAVRVPVNAAGMIAGDQLDNTVWDVLPISGSFSQEVDLLGQSLSSTTAPFWVHIPSMTQGQTRTVRWYFGNGELQRNQGVLFTGADSLSAAHHASLSITNNLSVLVELEMLDATAQAATLVSHWSANQGYRLLLIDNAGTLTLRAQVNALTCDLAWDSAWTNVNQDFVMRFSAAAGNDLFIDRNGVNAAACDTDAPSVTAVATPLTVGGTLSDGIIRNVTVGSTTAAVAWWGFDADGMTETVSANPYQGTIEDGGANNIDFTYTFNRDQAGLSATVGTLGVVGSTPAVDLVDAMPDILGPAFGRSISTPVTESIDGVFYTLILDSVADSTGHRGMAYAMTLGGLGLLLAGIVYSKARYIPLALFVAGVPPAVGVINGWLPAWWIFLWAILVIGSWFAVRQGESA